MERRSCGMQEHSFRVKQLYKYRAFLWENCAMLKRGSLLHSMIMVVLKVVRESFSNMKSLFKVITNEAMIILRYK
jgi:hypothetical protein